MKISELFEQEEYPIIEKIYERLLQNVTLNFNWKKRKDRLDIHSLHADPSTLSQYQPKFELRAYNSEEEFIVTLQRTDAGMSISVRDVWSDERDEAEIKLSKEDLTPYGERELAKQVDQHVLSFLRRIPRKKMRKDSSH